MRRRYTKRRTRKAPRNIFRSDRVLEYGIALAVGIIAGVAIAAVIFNLAQ